MGVVWLARDERLREDCRLKFLPSEIVPMPSRWTTCGASPAQSQTDPPNIIRIPRFFRSGRRSAVHLDEYVDGPNLNGLRAHSPSHLRLEHLALW